MHGGVLKKGVNLNSSKSNIMDKEAKEALKKSIEKWKVNLAMAKSGDYEIKTCAVDCPLCVLYFEQECEECPIQKRTGALFCYNTPYSRVTEEILESRKLERVSCNLVSTIEDEIKFLESLLFPNGLK